MLVSMIVMIQLMWPADSRLGPIFGECVTCFCVLEHCSTQPLNLELQQTITQIHVTRSQGDVRSQLLVGKGMEMWRIKTVDFRTFGFLFTAQVRLPVSCIQSEQNECNLNVST
jgi:hypothetical protein